MDDALTGCCDNVWAIIEVSPPYKDKADYKNSSISTGADGISLPWSSSSVYAAHENCSADIARHVLSHVAQPISNSSSAASSSASTNELDPGDTLEELFDWAEEVVPTLTIRMHPGSIPDTRNFE